MHGIDLSFRGAIIAGASIRRIGSFVSHPCGISLKGIDVTLLMALIPLTIVHYTTDSTVFPALYISLPAAARAISWMNEGILLRSWAHYSHYLECYAFYRRSSHYTGVGDNPLLLNLSILAFVTTIDSFPSQYYFSFSRSNSPILLTFPTVPSKWPKQPVRPWSGRP